MPSGAPDLAMRSLLTCNNMEALGGAVSAGLGIGCMPDFLVRRRLADGTLRTILDDHIDGPGQFHMLWPSNRHLSPKVRVLVDYLTETLFADRCDSPAVPLDPASTQNAHHLVGA
jgi:DNA-binding transcriptional LysR family regulator